MAHHDFDGTENEWNANAEVRGGPEVVANLVVDADPLTAAMTLDFVRRTPGIQANLPDELAEVPAEALRHVIVLQGVVALELALEILRDDLRRPDIAGGFVDALRARNGAALAAVGGIGVEA